MNEHVRCARCKTPVYLPADACTKCGKALPAPQAEAAPVAPAPLAPPALAPEPAPPAPWKTHAARWAPLVVGAIVVVSLAWAGAAYLAPAAEAGPSEASRSFKVPGGTCAYLPVEIDTTRGFTARVARPPSGLTMYVAEAAVGEAVCAGSSDYLAVAASQRGTVELESTVSPSSSPLVVVLRCASSTCLGTLELAATA